MAESTKKGSEMRMRRASLRPLLIGTANAAKFKRFRAALHQIPGIDLLSLDSAGIRTAVEEDHADVLGNALKKAMAYGNASGMLTVGIDEALHANFLPPHLQPGIRIRRLGSCERAHTDEEILDHWQGLLKAYPAPDRRIAFRMGVAYYSPSSGRTGRTLIKYTTHVVDTIATCVLPGYPLGSFVRHDRKSRVYAELSAGVRTALDSEVLRPFVDRFRCWLENEPGDDQR